MGTSSCTGAVDVNVVQIVTVVQMVPSTMAGGAQDALSTVQACTVPVGPQRVTVFSRVTLAVAVHVVTVVVMVNCTVAEIRKVALTKSVDTAGVLLWKLHVALVTAQLMPVTVPVQVKGVQIVLLVSAWKQ